ncbi:hypothetical protein [Streptomyces sp. NPDC046909]|uniref:hypothetical protein n=1 Tax=Streptomyces sp. NPDC046909 TaxID=3155617 RepID=UPI0033DB3192
MADEVELIEALLQPFRTVKDGLDKANVREEAETVVHELLALYEQGDEGTRVAVRGLLGQCDDFSWATRALPPGRTPEAFRRRLLYLSARDQAFDPRDEMVWLNDMCEQAREAGVDMRPLLLEIAELSSTEDKYGMGSLRGILLRAAERDPVGLW